MKGNGGEMKGRLLVLAYLAAKDVIRKVPLAFLLLLCLTMGGSLLLPSGMALAQAPAIEAANRGLQDVSEELPRPTSASILANGDFSQGVEGWTIGWQGYEGGKPYSYCTHHPTAEQGYLDLGVYGGSYNAYQEVAVSSLDLELSFRLKAESWATYDSLPSDRWPPNEIGTDEAGKVSVWLVLYDSGGNSIGSIEYYYSPNFTYDSTETSYPHKLGTGSPPPTEWKTIDVNVGEVVGERLRIDASKVAKVRVAAGVYGTHEDETYTVGYFDDFSLIPAEGVIPVTPTASPLAPTPHATPTPAWASVCAVAKPSITGGSLFTDAEFTIGGDEPQTIRVTTAPAENFTIVNEYGRIVYRNVNFESYGSLTLKPGTYRLSCAGRGALGLMSNKVCIQYPVAQEAPPAPAPEPRSSVVLPPREVVVGTLPDGSKLIEVAGPGRYTFIQPGGRTIAVGQTIEAGLFGTTVGGDVFPVWYTHTEPGHLAQVTLAGTRESGGHIVGNSKITGKVAGEGWLLAGTFYKVRLVVLEELPDPLEDWHTAGRVVIKGRVTYRGAPVAEASILLLHDYYCERGRCDDPPESRPTHWNSGTGFDDPDWKTEDDGSFTIDTDELLFGGRYRIRVVKMAEADKGQNFGSNMWSKNEPIFTLVPRQSAKLGPYEIEMETMWERYGEAIPPWLR